MGRMSTMAILSSGKVSQLKAYIDKAEEIKSAKAEGLEKVEVAADVNDPQKVEITTLWKNLDALKKYLGDHTGQDSLLSGKVECKDCDLEFSIDDNNRRIFTTIFDGIDGKA